MSETDFTDEKLKQVLDDAGLGPPTAAADRREWLRYETAGVLAFHRPQENDVHTGKLADVSEGGLAFVTRVSLAVGETLLLSYEEDGKEKAVEATVETVHSHPRDDSYLVGTRFVDHTPRARDGWILVHRVGYIADGETVDLAERIYTDPDRFERLTVEEWREHTLGENHKNWGKKFVSRNPLAGGSDVIRRFRTQDYQDALLMLTALAENHPLNLEGTYGAGHDFSRRNCGHLDRSDELTTDRFLLIGFVDQQGPVMLCTRSGGGRFRPLLASWQL